MYISVKSDIASYSGYTYMLAISNRVCKLLMIQANFLAVYCLANPCIFIVDFSYLKYVCRFIEISTSAVTDTPSSCDMLSYCFEFN